MNRLVVASFMTALSLPAFANDYPAPKHTATAVSRANGGVGGAGGSGGAGGVGGQGGVANVTIQNGGAAAQPASGAANSGSGYGTGVNIVQRPAAPSFALASPGGGGFDCPVVGIGLAGVGQPGGGSGLASWISPDCNKRKIAEILYMYYGPAVARAYMVENIAGVSAAVAAATEANAPAPAPVRPCMTADPGHGTFHLHQHPDCVVSR